MDLSILDTRKAADAGAVLELVHPTTHKPLDIFITLAGVDSQVWKDAQRRQSNNRLKKKSFRLSAEELEAEGVDMLAACTLDWENMILDGQELECSRENAARVYSRFSWLKEQVDEFIGDRANFLPNLS